ncbi:DUF4188 domain-containing protein [soil metagenome]
MARVQSGRYAAEIDRELVVFLIGMRVNRVWKLHRWLPAFTAMPRMLRELFAHPEKGLLAARFAWIGGPALVQYWRSFDDLERFARSADDPHLPAWRAFNRRAQRGPDVGIWHESYVVGPGTAESVYVNMPVVGLAAATSSAQVQGRRDSARDRLAAPGVS